MKNSSALITGVTGFIGSRLARRLVQEGNEVHALVRDTSQLQLIEDIAPRLNLHRLDGTTEGMARLLAQLRPAVVFHLASLFLAKHRLADVAALVESNVLFGSQLAEVVTGGDEGTTDAMPGFVNVGTAWQHYDSADYSPVALYAATKQAFQDVLRYYHEARGLSVVNLKFFDTYGPGDPRRKVLAVLRGASSESILGMTGGDQFIDLVHVDDVIEALLTAAARVRERPARFESFAVSSRQPLTIRQLAAAVEQALGRSIPIEWGAMPYREREMMTPWSAGPVLPNWAPRIALAEGLKRMESNA